MGSNKNKKTSLQPGRAGRPRKVKNKGKRALVDPPPSPPKSRPRPRRKRRPESASPEPDIHSIEGLIQSDAVLTATEGLLGLSKVGKTHASQPEDSDKGSTESDVNIDCGKVAMDLDEDDEMSKSSNNDSEDEEGEFSYQAL
jgi:hypothetical protein